MRQIGTLASEDEAKTLADYLLTLKITTRVDNASGGWVVWVHREERVDEAKRELDAFRQNPTDPRYQGVDQVARTLRKQKEKEDQKHIRNSIDLRGRWDYRPAERCPVTIGVIVISIAVFVAPKWNPRLGVSLIDRLSINAIGRSVFSMQVGGRNLDGVEMAAALGQMGWPQADAPRRFESLRKGQLWRLVTPVFLEPYANAIALLFTAFWFYDLGGLVEMRRGSWRLALMLVPIAVVSNLLEYVCTSNPFFGGMSGLVYGVFGYAYSASRQGKPGMPLRPAAAPVMLGWLLWSLCMGSGYVGVVMKVAGFATGLALSYVPETLRRSK